MELKLEHSALRENSEKERFELTSALLAAKNQVMELDSKALLAQTESIGHKENLAEIEKILRKEEAEAMSLRATLQEVRDTLAKERQRNLELGAELLTLVNQRDLLQRQCNDLQQKLDLFSVKMDSADSETRERMDILEELKLEIQVDMIISDPL